MPGCSASSCSQARRSRPSTWGTTGRTTSGEASVDGLLRLGGAFLGIWDGIKTDDLEGIEIVEDTYSGWDSPALSIDSSEEPTSADLISSHMVSLSLVSPPEDPDADLTSTERLLVTLMYVPSAEGGPGVFVSLGGSLTIDEKVGNHWVLSGRLASDAGFAAMLGKGITDVAVGLTEASQTVALSSVPDPTSAISFSAPEPPGHAPGHRPGGAPVRPQRRGGQRHRVADQRGVHRRPQ